MRLGCRVRRVLLLIYDNENKACNRNTPLGNVIIAYTAPLLSGGDISIPITNPYAFLYVALLDNTAFRTFFRSVCDKHTNRLGIVSYTDEIAPSNVLLSENPRKSHALYWSILQFGYPALGDENAWITAVAVRSNTVDLINGGLGCLFIFSEIIFPYRRQRRRTWNPVAGA